MPQNNWINFNELRKQLSFQAVLAHYNVELTPKAEPGQFVALCPLPLHRDAKGKTFSMNVEKGIFQCFGCKATGGVIDFAVLMEGEDKRNGPAVRKVAAFLKEKFVDKSEAASRSPAPATAKAQSENVVLNQPLNFELKTLDTEHPWFGSQKLTPATVEHFGLGFCARGFLKDRIAVPLVDDAAQLVGYAGLALDMKDGGEHNPRYCFPAPREHEGAVHVFDRGRLLYGGFRIAKAVKNLIVVRECYPVWKLFEGGFKNVVALMGDTCTEEQAAMLALLTADAARVWLLTDSSAKSEECARSLLPQVASSRMCRWLKVGKEEELVAEHPLVAALPKK